MHRRFSSINWKQLWVWKNHRRLLVFSLGELVSITLKQLFVLIRPSLKSFTVEAFAGFGSQFSPFITVSFFFARKYYNVHHRLIWLLMKKQKRSKFLRIWEKSFSFRSSRMTKTNEENRPCSHRGKFSMKTVGDEDGNFLLARHCVSVVQRWELFERATANR